MKKVVLLFLFASIATCSVNAQNADLKMTERPVKAAIKKEDGEMKTYVMVFLVAGKNRNQDKDEAEEIQIKHLKHLAELHEQGLLILAGPFMDESNVKGILVLNFSEIEKAKEHVEQDPAIIEGRLKAEYHLWYTKSGRIELP